MKPGRLLIAGGTVYFGMATATYLYMRSKKKEDPVTGATISNAGDNRSVFDRIASEYDSRINTDELLMGMPLLRRWLLSHASGDVLEVSCGTLRNLAYYSSPAVTSLTFVDSSREMLLQAYDKHKSTKSSTTIPASFVLADVQHLCSCPGSRTEPFPSESQTSPTTRFGPMLRNQQTMDESSFDTVVDTFGLCSCENPLQALQVSFPRQLYLLSMPCCWKHHQ